MAGINTLQMFETVPGFDRENFVEWTRSFRDTLQLSWPFLSKIISEFERPEPILRGNRGEDNTSDYDTDDSNPSDASGLDLGSLN